MILGEAHCRQGVRNAYVLTHLQNAVDEAHLAHDLKVEGTRQVGETVANGRRIEAQHVRHHNGIGQPVVGAKHSTNGVRHGVHTAESLLKSCGPH